jgi:FKBP-type peptidyl-prolyl cis-trans isomerase SlyD
MQPKVIVFHYTMTSADGEEIYSSVGQEPMAFIVGTGQVLPSLEAALQGMEKGEKKRVQIAAADAFGDYDQEKVFQVPKSQLPSEEVNVGDQFMTDQNSPPVTVVEVHDAHVIMDENHPLAGVDLVFDLDVTDVREATPEEIAHGHVHGTGGHQH